MFQTDLISALVTLALAVPAIAWLVADTRRALANDEEATDLFD